MSLKATTRELHFPVESNKLDGVVAAVNQLLKKIGPLTSRCLLRLTVGKTLSQLLILSYEIVQVLTLIIHGDYWAPLRLAGLLAFSCRGPLRISYQNSAVSISSMPNTGSMARPGLAPKLFVAAGVFQLFTDLSMHVKLNHFPGCHSPKVQFSV